MNDKLKYVLSNLIPITFVFYITNVITIDILKSENLWLNLGIYVLIYIIVFGIKKGLFIIWNNYVNKNR